MNKTFFIFLLVFVFLFGCESKYQDTGGPGTVFEEISYTLTDKGKFYEAGNPFNKNHIGSYFIDDNKVTIKVAADQINIDSVMIMGGVLNANISYINELTPIPETTISYVTLEINSEFTDVLIETDEKFLFQKEE